MVLTHTLSNGIRLVCEPLENFRSVAVGFWVHAGLRHEGEGEAGLSHFIEHMMFKGTEKRSARDISVAMDEVGGQLNAFTAKECTCYYAKVLDEHLPVAMDVLSDMLMHSVFDEAEGEKEKGVIIEEIHMVEDTPEDLVHELISCAFFGNAPLGRPILGTEQSVRSFTPDHIRSYVSRHYTPGNIVLAVAGHVDFEALVSLAEETLSLWPYQNAAEKQNVLHVPHSEKRIIERATEQLHLCMAWRGYPMTDEKTYALNVFNNVLGGGMSSRLFQSIREQRGLAYSVYSYPSLYTDTGMLTVYAGMAVEQGEAVAALIKEEIEKLLKGGIPEEEFAMSKNQLRGGYILGSESTSNRMNAIGKSLLLQGKTRTQDEVLDLIAAVTPEAARAAGEYCFAVDPAVAVVGPAGAIKLEEL
jgi:predicted Zn-dependent peptidase